MRLENGKMPHDTHWKHETEKAAAAHWPYGSHEMTYLGEVLKWWLGAAAGSSYTDFDRDWSAGSGVLF